MPPNQVDGRENGHTAYMYGNPVGVQCGMCSRRALVPLERIGADRGAMRLLVDRRFKCSACRSAFVSLFLFVARDEADDWAISRD